MRMNLANLRANAVDFCAYEYDTTDCFTYPQDYPDVSDKTERFQRGVQYLCVEPAIAEHYLPKLSRVLVKNYLLPAATKIHIFLGGTHYHLNLNH